MGFCWLAGGSHWVVAAIWASHFGVFAARTYAQSFILVCDGCFFVNYWTAFVDFSIRDSVNNNRGGGGGGGPGLFH